MKRTILILLLWGFMGNIYGQLIINHYHRDITSLSESEINLAKSKLHIAYGHTSHGSQITSGMTGLVDFANGGGKGLTLPSNIFAWNNGGTNNALDLHDYAMEGDLGYYPAWFDNTIAYLGPVDPATGKGTTNPDVNVIMWSWCGQVDDMYSSGLLFSDFLEPMDSLERIYSNVKFVYMTGHLDHWDEANNKAANDSIRRHCIREKKILYDFADIESYNPDGTYFEYANDNCDYYSNTGTLLGNWATEWRATHTEDVDWYSCSAAHSDALNANQKAYAAWHMFVELGKEIAFEEDSLALVALYNATDGDNWVNNSNWLTGALDTWYGVTVANKRIVELDLTNNDLTGEIPNDIGKLTSLQLLSFYGCNLTGDIPLEIQNLTNLTYLNLCYNDFDQIPIPDLSASTNLEELLLRACNFTGSIPDWLLHMDHLSRLDISKNDFTPAPVPDFSTLTNLRVLYVIGCDFTGSIPASLLQMSQLEYLDISWNTFDPTPIPDFSALVNLFFLSITDCNFTGSIPGSLLQLPKLERLNISDNPFSAEPMPDFSGLTKLTTLYAYSCNFTGNIPSSLCQIPSLNLLQLNNNQLSGPIPNEINNLSSLEYLYLENNNLSGSLPSELGNLQNLRYLHLFNNKFTGDLPSSLNGLPKLHSFKIENNHFSFTNIQSSGIAPEDISTFNYAPQDTLFAVEYLYNSNKLTVLDGKATNNEYNWYNKQSLLSNETNDTLSTVEGDGVYTCTITNPDYPSLSLSSTEFNAAEYLLQSDSLALVALYNATDGDNWKNNSNWLTGALDTWYGVTIENERVTELSLNSMNLNGELPTLIGNLNQLTRLSLVGNSKLSGSIPESIGNLKSLNSLNLYNCDYTGIIPNGILQLSNLTYLNIGFNNFSPNPMPDFSNLINLSHLNLSYCNFTGAIPSSLLGLTNIYTLVISNNNFTDAPMPDFSTMGLARLYASRCRFIGKIPSSLLSMSSITTLDLSSNQFDPDTIPDFTQMQLNLLDLSNCNLIGRIPSSLYELIGMSQLYLGYNSLEGEIENDFCNMINLYSVRLEYNNFNGTLPSELTKLSRLRYFDIYNNNFYGDIPQMPKYLFDSGSLKAKNNKFNFANLYSSGLPGNNNNKFSYNPQDIIFNLEYNSSTDSLIILDCRSPKNNFTWYKDDVEISDTTRSINIEESGAYYCIVDNSDFPYLAIFSDTLWVEVSSIPSELKISDTTVNDTESTCYNAHNTITVAGDGTDVIFENGSTVNLIAEQSIIFLPGFHAEQGSYTHAYITQNGSFCDELQSSIVAAEPYIEKSSTISTSLIEMNGSILKPSLKVYPNPNNGQFTLQVKNIGTQYHVLIYNTLGAAVYQGKINEESASIDLMGAKQGIYFVHVSNNKELITQKIIIK